MERLDVHTADDIHALAQQVFHQVPTDKSACAADDNSFTLESHGKCQSLQSANRQMSNRPKFF